MSTEHTFSATVGGHDYVVKTGRLAMQAGGAITLSVGESMLLATATMSRNPREGLDFFPLSVDFEEKMYAAGRIPGSFFKREGRPTTNAILTARLTDRPLRPLFPKGMRNDVQIIITALSSDGIHRLDILAVNSASIALNISDIPWNGPIAAVRVGYLDGQLVANPTIEEMTRSTLDLRVAGSADAIIMVEAAGEEIEEELMVEALAFAHSSMQPLIKMQDEMRAAVGKEKAEPIIAAADQEIEKATKERIGDRVANIVAENTDRGDRKVAMSALTDEIVESFVAEDPEIKVKEIKGAIDGMLKKAIRQRILVDGIRPDGRAHEQIRALSADVGITPRTHGSGLFQRGETQVLALTTLGMPREAQKLDGLSPEEERRYIHHYNFPPYSTGEAYPMRGPKRREIGHGALAERALLPMIPDESEFPYTIRVVSEVLSSNGSTSQASVCASSLSLMDCGVPLKKPVGGVAMGLIYDDASDNYAILSDIQGLEDHLGDMDFKVAGTRDGITAIQMDIKISGLSMDLMRQALLQAHAGRMEILDAMDKALSAPRDELSQYAPRMHTIQIDPEKIGAVIGKGGATVRSIQEEFEVSVDIQEDGTIYVAGVDGPSTQAAIDLIDTMTKGAELGQIYTGKVTRVVDFGCFVELLPGVEGLVHISQLARTRIPSVESAVQMGDEVMVMVTDIDDNGKVRLSRKAVLEGWTLEEAREQDRGGRKGGGRGDRRGGDRNRNRR